MGLLLAKLPPDIGRLSDWRPDHLRCNGPELNANQWKFWLECVMILPTNKATLIGAHRGASADAPENTIAAFDQAVADRAELIELDVHATVDGVLVIHHDFTLERTAGSPARLRDLTLAEVQSFDVGAWRGAAFAGQHIPTLDQVFQRFGNRILINVEIKFQDAPYDGIEQAVADAIRRHGLLRRVVVSSFDLETALRLRRIDREVLVSLLHETERSATPPNALDPGRMTLANMVLARATGMVGIHLDAASITADLSATARALGLGVLAWTVDAETEMRRLAALGIDAIVSNRPALLRQVVLETRGAQD
jgi:glycerophosphoryl diester phosphodiesterase